MITVLLLTLAHAGMPEGLDLDDIDRFKEGARLFDEGPDGCWDMTGTLQMRLFHDAGASAFGRGGQRDQSVGGTVIARFENHEWTRFHYHLDAEKEDWMVVRPFFGDTTEDAVQAVDAEGNILPPDPDSPMAAMRERMEKRRAKALAKNGEEAEDEPMLTISSLLSVEWDDAANEVLYIEEGQFKGFARGQVVSTHRFPAGSDVATALDIKLPVDVKFGVWPLQGSIVDGSVHIRGHEIAPGVILPLAQRLSAIANVFSQTVAIDGLVSFQTARRCAAVAPAPAVQPGVPSVDPT